MRKAAIGTEASEARYTLAMTLIRHPSTPCHAVSTIDVSLTRGRELVLVYRICGNPALMIPSPSAAPMHRRADELWLHSCFEAFVKPVGSEAYFEFNFAPTGDWQAYHLSGYREGRHPAEIATPQIETRSTPDGFELIAAVSLESQVDWRIGLSAVIEENDGAISYWALQHAPDKPDFHHPDSFALTVLP